MAQTIGPLSALLVRSGQTVGAHPPAAHSFFRFHLLANFIMFRGIHALFLTEFLPIFPAIHLPVAGSLRTECRSENDQPPSNIFLLVLWVLPNLYD